MTDATYTLTSPFITLEFDGRPDYWRLKLAAWVGFFACVAIALLYAYAVVFPAHVGFETALLVGIGLLVLTTGGGND